MSLLYLIRHAQASFGTANYDCLSDTGNRQADILASWFKRHAAAFDAIYAGTQQRHAQTLAAYLKAHADADLPAPHATDAFNEYDSENILKTLIPEVIREEPAFEKDVLQMLESRRAFQKVYEKIMRRWISRGESGPHLEPWNTYAARVKGGLGRIMAAHGSGSTVAVFTSGGPISVCIQQALDLSDEKTLELTWQIMNASVTRLKYRRNRLMLFGFNDVSHLELEKNSRLLTYR